MIKKLNVPSEYTQQKYKKTCTSDVSSYFASIATPLHESFYKGTKYWEIVKRNYVLVFKRITKRSYIADEEI